MVKKNHTLLRIYQNLLIHAVRVKILLSIFGLRHDSKPHLKGAVCVPAVRPLHRATEKMAWLDRLISNMAGVPAAAEDSGGSDSLVALKH